MDTLRVVPNGPWHAQRALISSNAGYYFKQSGGKSLDDARVRSETAREF